MRGARAVVTSVFLFAIMTGHRAWADGDFCKSEAFRSAFLEGRDSTDFPSLSDRLLSFGDRAVPCLREIAERGAASLGSACTKDPEGCRVWAIGALGTIKTEKAKQVLVQYVKGPQFEGRPLIITMAALGVMQCGEAREPLRRLLLNKDPMVRGQAVLSLGNIGNPADLGAMVKTTLDLPAEALGSAVRGLELLGDPRVIPPLEELLEKTEEPGTKGEIRRTLERLRKGKPLRVRQDTGVPK